MRNAAVEKIVGAYMASNEAEYDDEIALVADTLKSHGWIHEGDVVSEYLGLVMPCPECEGIRYDHKDGCANVGKKFLPTIKDVLEDRAVKEGK